MTKIIYNLEQIKWCLYVLIEVCLRRQISVSF